MSGITSEFSRIAEASESPTLGLLRLKWAPFVLAVFGESFDQASQTVKADRLHVRVNSYLEEMTSAGLEVPPGDGRSLCTSWMNARWLRRIHDGEDDEAYELTSAALNAQRVVENLARDRALLSESRLTTILSGVRRLATEANPDRDARIAALDKEIYSLKAERDSLAAGGEMLAAADDRMVEGYLDMRDLLGQLPSDFRRVEEALDHMRRDLIKQFRADERPKGDVLAEYLQRSEELSQQTEAGRAFEGALTILSDSSLLREFQDGLSMILTHPFAHELATEETLDFRRSANLLRRGLQDVQSTRTRLNRALSDFITSHDSAAEREVTRTLAALQNELDVWMQQARPRDLVPLPEPMPGKLDVDHVRTRFYDPAQERPVAELEDVWDDAPDAPDLDDVRRQGGPMLREVRRAVRHAISSGATTLGEAFNTLPTELRRPVELFGLMQLAAVLEESGTTEPQERVTTVRPDGSAREFSIPQLLPERSSAPADADTPRPEISHE